MGVNIIEEAFQEALKWIQAYGWFVVFTLVALYYAWPQIQAFKAQKSLNEANDPQRKSVLDAQCMRVRLNRQLSLNQEEYMRDIRLKLWPKTL